MSTAFAVPSFRWTNPEAYRAWRRVALAYRLVRRSRGRLYLDEAGRAVHATRWDSDDRIARREPMSASWAWLSVLTPEQRAAEAGRLRDYLMAWHGPLCGTWPGEVGWCRRARFDVYRREMAR